MRGLLIAELQGPNDAELFRFRTRDFAVMIPSEAIKCQPIKKNVPNR
jgi:hypothetical protein